MPLESQSNRDKLFLSMSRAQRLMSIFVTNQEAVGNVFDREFNLNFKHVDSFLNYLREPLEKLKLGTWLGLLFAESQCSVKYNQRP
jgi:hypothetical protein